MFYGHSAEKVSLTRPPTLLRHPLDLVRGWYSDRSGTAHKPRL